MKITPKELKKLGFKSSSWIDEGTKFTEYVFGLKDGFKIEVYGEKPEVDLVFTSGDYTTTNLETMEDVKQLIRFFK